MSPENKYVRELLAIDSSEFLASLSIDCVILGFQNGSLKVLLNKFTTHRKWMLPGGFVKIHEDVDKAAYRILKERTGLQKIYLTQFHLFGNHDRVDMEENRQTLKKLLPEAVENHWYTQRFVSVGYYALVDYSRVKIKSHEEDRVKWYNLGEVPDLYVDHNQIITKAIECMRKELAYIPVGLELLPPKFAMSELRRIYETILGHPLDRRNFQRKMVSSGLVIPLEEVSKKPGVKTTALFSFDRKKYETYLQQGIPLL